MGFKIDGGSPPAFSQYVFPDAGTSVALNVNASDLRKANNFDIVSDTTLGLTTSASFAQSAKYGIAGASPLSFTVTASLDQSAFDDPPVIISTPSVVFTEGVANTYDMTQHVSDDGLSTVTYQIINPLASGLTFNTGTGILTYDGVGTASTTSHQLRATDAVGSDTSASFNISISDLGLWEWNFPSLQDETDFYTNVLGWSIPGSEPGFGASFEEANNWKSPPSFSLGDITNGTEADDLQIWDQQAKRYGSSFIVRNSDTVGDWRTEVLDEYKTNLLIRLDQHENTSVYPHMYGQGLCTVYNDTQDATILPILDGLRTRIEQTSHYQSLITSPPIGVSTFGARAVARQALISTYAVQATNDPNWITVRDNFVTAYATATNWQDYLDTPTMAPGTGMYFGSRGNFTANISVSGSGYANPGEAYDDGYRFNSTFQVGLLVNAVWRLYVQTGNETLRDRLIKMARYILYYAHDPSWNYPNVGSYWGHTNTGGRWWTRNIIHGRGDGTFAQADTETAYDASLANAMVIGYKLTGEQAMLDFGRYLFERTNRWKANGALIERTPGNPIPDNEVLKYADTTADSSDERFRWNKSVTQYCDQLFENGGVPSTVPTSGVLETIANGMSSNTWQLVADSNDSGSSADTLRTLTVNTAGQARSAFEYSHQFFWNSAKKEMHFRGGGASNDSDRKQRHVRFRDTTGAWEAMTPWINASGQPHTHQWGAFCGDRRTGDLYMARNASGGVGDDIHKWTYTETPSTDGTGATSWPYLTEVGVSSPGPATRCLGFFPDWNNNEGALIYYNSYSAGTGIYASDASLVNFGSNLGTPFPNSGFETIMIYCPYQKWMLFGGGSGSGGGQGRWLGRVQADGTIDRLNDVPTDIGASSEGKLVAFENGRIFLVQAVTFNIWEYNEGSDSWSQAGLTQPPFTQLGANNNWSAFCPIPEYGVIYCVVKSSAGAGRLQEWLYKL